MHAIGWQKIPFRTVRRLQTDMELNAILLASKSDIQAEHETRWDTERPNAMEGLTYQ